MGNYTSTLPNQANDTFNTSRRRIQSQVTDWSVLVIDDQLDNIAVIERMLTFYGAKVHTARSGEQGLLMLEMIDPSFVLLDLNMPRVSGWEVARQIRSNPATAPLPIIALSAQAMEAAEREALEALFDGFVAKPFRIKTFLSHIKNAVAPLIASQ